MVNQLLGRTIEKLFKNWDKGINMAWMTASRSWPFSVCPVPKRFELEVSNLKTAFLSYPTTFLSSTFVYIVNVCCGAAPRDRRITNSSRVLPLDFQLGRRQIRPEAQKVQKTPSFYSGRPTISLVNYGGQAWAIYFIYLLFQIIMVDCSSHLCARYAL